MDILGGISAAITMEGSIYVEKGGNTGIIGRYQENPGAFIVTTAMEAALSGPEEPSGPSQPPPGRSEASPPAAGRAAEAIIADMAEILERDPAIGDAERNDAIADLAALKLQLSRSATNTTVVEALWTVFAAWARLRPWPQPCAPSSRAITPKQNILRRKDIRNK